MIWRAAPAGCVFWERAGGTTTIMLSAARNAIGEARLLFQAAMDGPLNRDFPRIPGFRVPTICRSAALGKPARARTDPPAASTRLMRLAAAFWACGAAGAA